MAAWTVLACDLRTGAVIDELPLSNIRFTDRLNGAGDWSATLDLNGLDAGGQRRSLAATAPARTCVWFDRGGTLLYPGIVWTRRRSSGRLTLGGLHLWSYWRRRRSAVTYKYSQVDQGEMMRQLVAGGVPGPYVLTPAAAPSFPRDRTYWAYERRIVSEAVEQLAGVEAGADFSLELAYGATAPQATFSVWWPRRGRAGTESGWVFDDSNIRNVDVGDDGSQTTNRVHAIGAGEGDTMLLTTISSPVADIYPVLEDALSLKDVSETSTLLAHAYGHIAVFEEPTMEWKLEVETDLDPPLGSWSIGDDVRVMLDPRPEFPDGWDAFHRIIGHTVSVGDGNSPDVASLALAAAF